MAVSSNALSPDSQVIAMLCTGLGVPRASVIKPLTAAEWSDLAASIYRSELEWPRALLGLKGPELTAALRVGPETASRLEALLERGGQLAFELDRLSGRGIWLLTRADSDYPQPLKDRLKKSAPPVLYGAGKRDVISRRAAAVVGSRDASEESLEFATRLGRRLAQDGVVVVSGAARGVDSTAMLAAVDAGGMAIGVVADSLEKSVRRQDLRSYISDGSTTLLSPFHPGARFTVGNAMSRNRLIYCLGEIAFIVVSGVTGGTREGALEALKARWVPVFVNASAADAKGNRDLLSRGASPIVRDELDSERLLEKLAQRLEAQEDMHELQLEVELPSSAQPGHARGDDVVETSPQRATSDSDLFRVVWPSIAAFLSIPHSEREIASEFELQLSQVRAWLKRADDQQLVERHGRERRYQTTADREKPTLFDA